MGMSMTMNPNTTSDTVTPGSVTSGAINQGMVNSMMPQAQNALPQIGNPGPAQPFMTNSAFFPKDQNTMEMSGRTQVQADLENPADT